MRLQAATPLVLEQANCGGGNGGGEDVVGEAAKECQVAHAATEPHGGSGSAGMREVQVSLARQRGGVGG